jgi:hypothetical protein
LAGARLVKIRNYQQGDEAYQVAIYNEAAGALPGFKPATVDEIARRCRARQFDPATRFLAEVDGRPVGYATFHANGRVSFPWCRQGHEDAAEPLFESVLEAMKARGLTSAFAAYRGDWPVQAEFFLRHGFHLAREMINYVLDLTGMPTRPSRRTYPITPLQRDDIPAIFDFGRSVVRSRSPEELAAHLFDNPYFQPEELFVLRSRDETPLGVGLFITHVGYADPKQVDPFMPCFRLGAFGTEGMQTKRINGMFSVLTRDQGSMSPHALDLMGHAATLLEESGHLSLAAQVPSDAGDLVRFYNRFFRRQGGFPVFERQLVSGE